MSYDSKIAAARDVIEQHNSNVTDSKVDFDSFVEKLRNMGGSSDEALKAVSWEDLQDCGLPKIMARRMSFIFRQESDGSNPTSSAYISSKKVHELSIKELVSRYNPKDSKSPVGKRLNELSSGKAFIVFDDNGGVNVEVSLRLLEDLSNGLPEVDTAFAEGIPLHVYKVGQLVDAYADENPLYPGRALRSGETCDQSGRSWNGIGWDIRQLLYIAVGQTKELKVNTVADAGDVMDKVMPQGCTINALRARYPNASKAYDDMKKIGKLPILKIKLGGSSNNKSNNPFGASEPKIW